MILKLVFAAEKQSVNLGLNVLQHGGKHIQYLHTEGLTSYIFEKSALILFPC